MEPIGYLDDNPLLVGNTYLDLPVLGPLSQAPEVAHDAVVLAIGDNKVRGDLFVQLSNQQERFATVIHPAAVVAADVRIGVGTVICAGVIINTGSHIGNNVILNTGCTIDHHNDIGNHVHVAPGVHLGGDVQIGTGTLIGIGATVMPQRRVGNWSVVGAGALVHADLPDSVVAVGVPARVIRTHRHTESITPGE